MKLATLLLSALPLCAQTVPVELVVNFPPHQLVTQKYGPLPKWAMFGELTACNRGTTNLTYGEGDVVALLRVQASLQAFSIQDALSLVGNSQATSPWNRAKAWLGAVATTAVESKATGIIGGGNKTGAAIVVGAEAVNILLPNLQGALTLKQLIQYSKDGMVQTMSVPAGRCTIPYSVLFAVPGPSPAATQPLTIRADVPADR